MKAMKNKGSQELALAIVDWALDKKAEDLTLLDLSSLSDVADAFVLCSATSETQVRAIADAIVQGGVDRGEKASHVEGRETGRWVLIDFIVVVVHVMLPDLRQLYSLERLWADAGVTRFDETGTVIARTESAAVEDVSETEPS
jgi:ribosome-associated protein